MTKWILSICILIVFSVFFLNLMGGAIAEDCQTDGKSAPTPPGDTSYPYYWQCDCTGEKPIITATYSDNPGCENDEISDDCPVTLSATDGCPPYTWSTDSLGYSLTDNGDGTVTLSVVSGTCGTDYDIYATVTVTDSCPTPVSSTIEIRNSSGGWDVIESCYWTGSDCSGCVDLLPNPSVHVIVGYQSWVLNGSYECTAGADDHGYTQYCYDNGFIDPPCGSYEECGEVHATDFGCDPGKVACVYYVAYRVWTCED